MKDSEFPIGISILILVVGFMIGTAASNLFQQLNPQDTHLYKRGQIDAVNGKVLYELKKWPDGTVTWERKKNETVSSQ